MNEAQFMAMFFWFVAAAVVFIVLSDYRRERDE